MKTLWYFALVMGLGCAGDLTSSNDIINNPPDPVKKYADVRIIASDVRLRYPTEIELYVKIMNYGPAAAYEVKASLDVFAHDTLAGAIIINFRDGGRLGVYELDKNTVDLQFDSTWQLQEASDVKYGKVKLTWITR